MARELGQGTLEFITEFNPDLFAVPTALLCSEPTAKHCHRRVVVEYLDEKWNGVKAVHR